MSEVNVQIQNPKQTVNINNPVITIEMPTDSISVEIVEGQPIEIQVQNPVIEVNIGGPCDCGDGGGGTWGSITGTLSDQTDLQSALDGKSDTGHTHPLSDLTQSGATVGQIARWDGAAWVPDDEAGGGPGGASYTEVTYSEMEALIAANGLTPGGWYLITDASGTDLGFLTNAVTENEINVSGVGGYLNADFQAVGDYSGTPETFVAQQGIWNSDNEAGYTQGDVTIWNLSHYQLTDSGAIDGTDPATNTAAYTLLDKATYPETYVTAWDVSEWSFVNNRVDYRNDGQGNVIYGENGVLYHRWGDNRCQSNVIYGGYIDGRNYSGSYNKNTIYADAAIYDIEGQSSSYIDNCFLFSNSEITEITLGDNSFLGNNIIKNGASLIGITAGANCSVSRNEIGQGATLGGTTTMGDGANIDNNVIGAGSDLSSVSIGVDSIISNNILENGASITGITAGANCSISRNKIGQGATLGNGTTMGDGAQMNGNILPAGYRIGENCILSTGANINFNTNTEIVETVLGAGASIRYNNGPSGIAICVLGESAFIAGCTGAYFSEITMEDSAYFENILFPGSSLELVTLTTGIHLFQCIFENTYISTDTISETFEFLVAKTGFSNFTGTIDITGLTTLDCTAAWAQYRGIYNIASGNATEAIDTITNPPTAFPFTIRPAPGLVLTITGTAYAGIAAGQIALKAASYVLDGDKGEYIVLEIDPLGTGALIEKQVVNGLI